MNDQRPRSVGIVDEPNPRGESDGLGIERHARSLITFISNCETPITIGIQGEWGSGKTSLLNSIYSRLAPVGEVSKYHQIWVNAWEHSLLVGPEEALLNITNDILQGMLAADQEKRRSSELTRAAGALFKGALRVGATAALGVKAGEVAEELLASNGSTVRALREELSRLSTDIRARSSNPFEKIIVYVDDLDRIEPRDAVTILELLKNIFSVPGCVFVLAIDYQVVVKGLEAKFGKRTEENEWEFRAFFDKIIQLPFMMPMSQYNIGRYVADLLARVGFGESDQLDETVLQSMIGFTIGGNPRSLKRLVNSIALIDIFMDLGETAASTDGRAVLDERSRLLLFGMVCLQISFPTVYDLLVVQSDFLKWDEALAAEITQLREMMDPNFERNFEAVQGTSDFDEEWERALYRMCYVTPRLRARVSDASRFFNFLRTELFKGAEQDIASRITEVLGYTAVTTVNASDQAPAKRTNRDFSKYSFDGRLFNKARLVNAVLAKDARERPDLTLELMKKRFPDEIQGALGVFSSLEDALAVFERTGYKRHYVKDSELIHLADGAIATCNGWDPKTIGRFVDRARELGHDIRPAE